MDPKDTPLPPPQLEEVLVRYFAAIEGGLEVDVEEILASHPELAEEIERFLRDEANFLRRLGALPRSFQSRLAQLPVPSGGRIWGDYEFLDEIGRGGMGVVYRVIDRKLKRIVALKMVLRQELALPLDLHRFHTEAEAAAALEHPNIVPIYQVGEIDGCLYFSMKYLDGGSLASNVCRYRGSYSDAARLVEKIARAVHHAHQRGVLHRDLKPGNILFDRDGEVFVTDFGLAKRLNADASATTSGTIVGTLAYMAPEQARGDRKALSTAADVYSLGVILYELLSGSAPFRGDSSLDVLRLILEAEPKSLLHGHPRLPRDLETICLKCLRKEPEQRYASCEALADDLRRQRLHETILARPSTPIERFGKWMRRQPAVAALVVVSVLAVAALGSLAVLSSRSVRMAAEREVREYRARDLLGRSFQYTARLHQAYEAWADNRCAFARKLLGLLTPATGEPDLRGFDWYWLSSLLCQELCSLPRGLGDLGERHHAAAAILPGGDRFAYSGEAGRLRTWKAAGRQEAPLKEWVLNEWAGDSAAGLGLTACTRDGRRLAWSDGRDAGVYDLIDGRLRWRVRPGAGRVVDIAFSPDGGLLAVASDGAPIVFLDAMSGFLAAASDVACETVSFAPDGATFAVTHGSGREAASVGLYAGLGRLRIGSLEGHEDRVRHAAFSPRGGIVATAGSDHSVRTWDARAAKEISRLDDRFAGFNSLSFSADGSLLAAAADDGRWKLLAVGVGGELQELREFKGHEKSVISVTLSPEGRRAVTSSRDGTVKYWETSAAGGSLALPHTGHILWELGFGADGKTLVTASNDFVVKVWRLDGPRCVEELATVRAEEPWRYSCGCLSADARRAAVGTPEGGVEVWRLHWEGEAAGFAFEAKLQGQRTKVGGLRFSPDGRGLVSGSSGGRTVLWQDSGGAAESRWRQAESFELPFSAKDFAFSRDGKLLAASSEYRREVALRELVSPRRQLVLADAPGPVTSIAFSQDSRLIAAGVTDGSIFVWRVESGPSGLEARTWGTLEWHKGPVSALLFPPDGITLLSGSDDGSVKVWQLIDSPGGGLGIQRVSFREFEGEVKALALSPDGRSLAASGGRYGPRRGEVRLWRAVGD
jgi:WD40 repeat protein/tRNA A-37 threonylcarbamoyl transferase component Bud32